MYLKNRKRLFVVLGMHRSGTSAITKSLELFGINLGKNLHPAGNDNPKGFWEDRQCLEINEELLRQLDSDYDTLAPAWIGIPQNTKLEELKSRAIQHIANQLESNTMWGFKDPRTCRLLFFWNEVFEAVQCEVNFLIVVRNPASVAASLAKRNQLPAEKSYFLWLQHVIPLLKEKPCAAQVFVDFDEFISNPYSQLSRIAKELQLNLPAPKTQKVESYINDFLEIKLRHTQYNAKSLIADPRASALVTKAYNIFQLLTRDQIDLRNSTIQQSIKNIDSQLRDISPLWVYTKNIEKENEYLQCLNLKNENEFSIIQRKLLKTIKNMGEKDFQSNQLLAKKNNVIKNLQDTLAKKKEEIKNLEKALSSFELEIKSIQQSKCWRITTPLRTVSELLFTNNHPEKIDLNTKESPKEFVGKLPEGFDPDIYLKLNPDVRRAGVDPKLHYIQYGRNEGRLFNFPHIEIPLKSSSSKDTILIVCHEASRTGAPMLGLNLVQKFSAKYNVIVLLLKKGPLVSAFQETGALVITPSQTMLASSFTEAVVAILIKKVAIKFAIINSIESHTALDPLVNNFIPTTTLIHEFAAYYPKDTTIFKNVFISSNKIIFSTNITWENAVTRFPELEACPVHVIPQGHCQVPSLSEGIPEEKENEIQYIRQLIRPKVLPEETTVIIGAGTVEIRKGVDLFIDCANRVIREIGKEKCRFIWIGKGFSPEKDMSYSAYLGDQLQRSEFGEYITFANETSEIETAYKQSDILMLTSRLDPLPNVAIDAMAFGLPVVCFEKTTGIADFLIQNGLKNNCVASYLDVADMAEKIQELIRLPFLRKKIGEKCHSASLTYFNMDTYTQRLDTLSQENIQKMQQLKGEYKVIFESNLFRSDFSSSSQLQTLTREEQISYYLNTWKTGIARRKPFPGFHPGIYLEEHGVPHEGNDPFADYILNAQPNGTWTYPVIAPNFTRQINLPGNKAIALHIHVNSTKSLAKIIERLNANQIAPDLLISTPITVNKEELIIQLSRYKGEIADIQKVPISYKKIDPFLTTFKDIILSRYEYIGHIHTHICTEDENAEEAISESETCDFFWGNLIGGTEESGTMADQIICYMVAHSTVGLIIPDDPDVAEWGSGLSLAKSLAEQLGIFSLPKYPITSRTTMFWAKTAALMPLFSLNWNHANSILYQTVDEIHIQNALAQIFSLIPLTNNYQIATTNVKGLTR